MSAIQKNITQFFFDDSNVLKSCRVTRQWMQAKIFPEPLLAPIMSWEGRRLCLFGTALKDHDGSIRLYYSNHVNDSQDIMIAHSKDGFSFTRPSVKTIDYDGSNDNNLVVRLSDSTLRADSPSIVFNEQDEEYPYKMIYAQKLPSGTFTLMVRQSKDGYFWSQPTATGMSSGDRTNAIVNPVDGKYIVYTRGGNMKREAGIRCIYRSESKDFFNWTKPEIVLLPGTDDPCDVEYYGMSVFLRHEWYIGLLEYWSCDRDEFEIRMVVSRDGINWSRPSNSVPFIAPKYYWNKKWNSCASNGPVILNEQMVFYFGAGNVSHGFDTLHRHGVIGAASVPIDRFCALYSNNGGTVITKPVCWHGGELVINADTRVSLESHPKTLLGKIDIDLLDEQLEPMDGWKATYRGNIDYFSMGKQKVEFSQPLDTLKGKCFHIKFTLYNAHLYTFGVEE